MYPTIVFPSFEVCGESDTWLVWRSAEATPASFSAWITLVASSAFCASAAAAVFARDSTLKPRSARSGMLVTVPLPVTVIVFSAVAAARPRCGCATPAIADAASSSRASGRILRIRFMQGDTAPLRRIVTCASVLRGGGGRADVAEVRRPAVRDARCCELDEAHRLRWPRRVRQVHADLLERAVALAQVAWGARGDDVLPDRLAALRARDHVVEREPAARGAAVDAAPAVPGEEGPSGDLALDRPGYPHVVDEPDHVRPDEGGGRGPERLGELLDDLGPAFVKEHVGAPNRAHVQRLVAGVQDENLLHLARKIPARAAVPLANGRLRGSLRGHGPLDRLELLGRERDGGPAAVELLHVDARVVA